MKVYYDRRLITRALPTMVHAKFAQRRGIPKRGGKTIEFRKFATLGVSKTPLTEGTPPSGQSLSVSAITATVEQYGDVIFFSDLVSTTTFDPILEETTDLLAEQSSESIDELIRDTLITGTNVQYHDGAVATSTVTIQDTMFMDVATVRRAVLTLVQARARKINGYWQAIISPEQSHDLQGTSEWVNAQQYAAQRGESNRLFEGSLGALYGVMFWVTDKVSVLAAAGADAQNIHQALFMGANAYGIVDLAGHNLRAIYKPLGSAGTADPIDQQQSMGWKLTFTTRILADEFIVRVETSASQDLP
jgi:N4-gp56 family major capsid protein